MKKIMCLLTIMMVIATYADDFEDIQNITQWKILYTPDRGVPPEIQWRTTYPDGSIRVVDTDTPWLLAVNDFNDKSSFAEFVLSDNTVPDQFNGRVAVDFRVRPIDFGKKDFFFLFLARFTNQDGKELPVIVKIGQNQIYTSAGLVDLKKPLGDQPVRITLLADLNRETMSVWIDGRLDIDKTKIMSGDKTQGKRISFGDGSSGVSGIYLLQYLKITTLQ